MENSLSSGVPDVCYLLHRLPRLPPVCGWLELKYEPAFQKTGLRLRQLTKDQVLWQEDWASQGGFVFTLARVGKEFFLLKPDALRRVFTTPLSHPTVKALACGYWDKTLVPSELVKCLTQT